MDAGVALAVALALVFAFTNGVQDSANSIATLIATRAGRPGPALVMATVAIFAGPFLLGSAVADTVAGIVDVEPDETVEVVTAALVAALVWNGRGVVHGDPVELEPRAHRRSRRGGDGGRWHSMPSTGAASTACGRSASSASSSCSRRRRSWER